jgi:hypothetical protein
MFQFVPGFFKEHFSNLINSRELKKLIPVPGCGEYRFVLAAGVKVEELGDEPSLRFAG